MDPFLVTLSGLQNEVTTYSGEPDLRWAQLVFRVLRVSNANWPFSRFPYFIFFAWLYTEKDVGVTLCKDFSETKRPSPFPIQSTGKFALLQYNPSWIFFPCFFIIIFFWLQRGLHSRNKKAAEFLAQGFSAIKEVDRVMDKSEPNSRLLIPLLRVW